MRDNQSNIAAKACLYCGAPAPEWSAYCSDACCERHGEREQIVEYLEQRASTLRSVQPTKESERVADALDAEARRIKRGDHAS